MGKVRLGCDSGFSNIEDGDRRNRFDGAERVATAFRWHDRFLEAVGRLWMSQEA